MKVSLVASGITASIVGFGGTVAVVIAAASALGATKEQTASTVTALCLVLAVSTLLLCWRFRMPILTAWSTPGAALVAASVGFTINEGIGAYLVAALLMLVTGLFKPLTRLISAIPGTIAASMLAGILAGFAFGAARSVVADPVFVLPLIAAFFLLRLWSPALSVIIVLIGGVLAAFLTGRAVTPPALELSTLTLIEPSFSLTAILSLSLPIYLVTMASQNLSGLAVLNAAGYRPPAGPLIATTGVMSLVAAPFGGSTTNLSAMAAAICTGPDAHPDSTQRWLTGPFYTLTYLVFAVFGASLVSLFAVLPPTLIVLVAGLALLGSFTNALGLALAVERERFASVVCFAVTASGLSIAGIGSAFWGLGAGLIVLALDHVKKA